MREKNNRSTGMGIAFIVVGLFLIAYKFDFIDFRLFWSVVNLWPLIFVVVGINIIFKKTTWVKALTWTLFIVIVVLNSYYFENGFKVFGRSVSYNIERQEHIIEYESDIKDGELRLKLGAGRLDISSGHDYLIESNFPKKITTAKDSISNNRRIIVYETINNNIINQRTFGNDGYEYNIKLNENVSWDVDIDMGAMDAKLDMRDIAFDDLDIDIGAGQLELYLDDINENASISIDSGVSDIDIYIPEDMSVKLKYDGGIKDIDFIGDSYYKKDGDYYYSDDYSSDFYYYIDINTGVGNLSIRDY